MESPILYWLFGSIIHNQYLKKNRKNRKNRKKPEQDTEMFKKGLSELKTAVDSCKDTRKSAQKYV